MLAFAFRSVDEGVRTEEDGDQSDVLFFGRRDCLGKCLVLSVADLLLNGLSS